MDTGFLYKLGQIAGIAGISLGILMYIFREILRKNIFPKFTPDQGYRTIRLIIICTFLISLIGLLVQFIFPSKLLPANPQAEVVLNSLENSISNQTKSQELQWEADRKIKLREKIYAAFSDNASERIEAIKDYIQLERKNDPSKIVNLHSINLANADLNSIDFSNTNLSNSIFDNAKFIEANFKGARLDNASMVNVSLYYNDFSFASLAGADFSGASGLSYPNWNGANLANIKGIPEARIKYLLDRGAVIRKSRPMAPQFLEIK